jgi:hypothetical protein
MKCEFYFRKTKLIDSDEECPKIAKTSPESSPASSSSSSSTVVTSANIDEKIKIEKEESDCWYQLEDGGEIKDLLPSGVVKNSSKLRFDVKEISLTEDL